MADKLWIPSWQASSAYSMIPFSLITCCKVQYFLLYCSPRSCGRFPTANIRSEWLSFSTLAWEYLVPLPWDAACIPRVNPVVESRKWYICFRYCCSSGAQRALRSSSDIWRQIHSSNLEWTKRKNKHIPVFSPATFKPHASPYTDMSGTVLLRCTLAYYNLYLRRACGRGHSDSSLIYFFIVSFILVPILLSYDTRTSPSVTVRDRNTTDFETGGFSEGP